MGPEMEKGNDTEKPSNLKNRCMRKKDLSQRKQHMQRYKQENKCHRKRKRNYV